MNKIQYYLLRKKEGHRLMTAYMVGVVLCLFMSFVMMLFKNTPLSNKFFMAAAWLLGIHILNGVILALIESYIFHDKEPTLEERKKIIEWCEIKKAELEQQVSDQNPST
jgi:Fe2+ transport system protein B